MCSLQKDNEQSEREVLVSLSSCPLGHHFMKSLGLRGVTCICQLLNAQMQPVFGSKVYTPFSTPSCSEQRRQVREGDSLN